MAHGILPSGTTEMQRDAVATADEAGTAAGSAVRQAPGAISNMVSSISDSVSNLFSGDNAAASEGEDSDPATPGAKPARKFSWGNTIGGILGVGGAWLLSSVFGGGWLGTVMFALFAIPGFMMGHSQLGGTMSRLFGETPRTPAKGADASTPDQAVGKERASTPEQTASTPQQQLQAEIAEVAEKSKVARAMVFRMVHADEISGRRGNELMNDVVPVENKLHRVQELKIDGLSQQELSAIHSEFTKAEKGLDRIIGMDPILKAKVQQDMSSVAAPGTPAYTNTHTTIGAVNLPPQAQQAVNTVREGAQNYAYSAAHEVALPSQNYTGQPSSVAERR